jgi:hypothetical protein|tara:strand:+ start:216 stop:437 length:222 start_codon:yes stop_codon:yes gene_type:complete
MAVICSESHSTITAKKTSNFFLKVYLKAMHGFEGFPKHLGKKCSPLNCLEYNEEAHKLSIADLKIFIETHVIQ